MPTMNATQKLRTSNAKPGTVLSANRKQVFSILFVAGDSTVRYAEVNYIGRDKETNERILTVENVETMMPRYNHPSKAIVEYMNAMLDGIEGKGGAPEEALPEGLLDNLPLGEAG